MSGEYSGHFAFRDNFYTDSGFLAFLIILEVIGKSGQLLSELVKPYQVYYQSSEISLVSVDVLNRIKQVREKYDDGQIDDFDGLTIVYPDWWFNLRPSHTESGTLRLIIEGKDKKLVEQKKTGDG